MTEQVNTEQEKEAQAAMEQAIYEKAQTMVGRDLTVQEQAVLLEMCRCAGAELESRLRTGVSPGDIRVAFVTAAGVLALSLYIQLGDSGETASSLKLGDVSIQRRSANAARVSAASLRRQAEAMLMTWLEDRGFDFRGVRG